MGTVRGPPERALAILVLLGDDRQGTRTNRRSRRRRCWSFCHTLYDNRLVRDRNTRSRRQNGQEQDGPEVQDGSGNGKAEENSLSYVERTVIERRPQCDDSWQDAKEGVRRHKGGGRAFVRSLETRRTERRRKDETVPMAPRAARPKLALSTWTVRHLTFTALYLGRPVQHF